MTATPVTDLTAPPDADPIDAAPPNPVTPGPATPDAAMLDRSLRPIAGSARLTLAATIGYVVAWIAGLTVFSSSTQVTADGAQVVRSLAGHQFAAGLQYALTEGATALCLIVVIWAVTGSARPGRARATIRLAALAATVVSLAECGLGLWLSAGLAHPGDAGLAGAVNDAITRLDGLKMLLLALTAATAAVAVRNRTLPLPRWLAPLAAVLALALVVSGVGYLAVSNAFASAAWISLPLLIVFVTAAGLATARLRR
jgi:hypothetical protein